MKAIPKYTICKLRNKSKNTKFCHLGIFVTRGRWTRMIYKVWNNGESISMRCDNIVTKDCFDSWKNEKFKVTHPTEEEVMGIIMLEKL